MAISFVGEKTTTEAIALEFIDEPYKPLLLTKENFEKLTTLPANKDMCYRSLKIVDEINRTLQVKLNDRNRNFLANLESDDIKLVDFEHCCDQSNLDVTDEELHALSDKTFKKQAFLNTPYPPRFWDFTFKDTDYADIFQLFNQLSTYQPFAWHQCQIL